MAYFTEAELREEFPELSSVTKYPAGRIESARVYAEARFERACRVGFGPRTTTEVLTGTGSTKVFLSNADDVTAVLSAQIDGVALTADELATLVVRRYGVVVRAETWPAGATITIEYVHGYAEVDELAKVAVMLIAADHLLPSAVPARATVLNTDVGSFRISQADKTGKTGIPEVDAIIGLLADDRPVTG